MSQATKSRKVTLRLHHASKRAVRFGRVDGAIRKATKLKGVRS